MSDGVYICPDCHLPGGQPHDPLCDVSTTPFNVRPVPIPAVDDEGEEYESLGWEVGGVEVVGEQTDPLLVTLRAVPHRRFPRTDHDHREGAAGCPVCGNDATKET